MQRQWYLGLGIIIISVLLLMMIMHDVMWFLAFLIPIIVIAIHDLFQKKNTILRNFPVLGHLRYILEFIRPEIQQYFIASDESERPFNREIRSVIYQRAKNVRDTIPFGTEKNILRVGYSWVLHSLDPKHVSEVETIEGTNARGCKIFVVNVCLQPAPYPIVKV